MYFSNNLIVESEKAHSGLMSLTKLCGYLTDYLLKAIKKHFFKNYSFI